MFSLKENRVKRARRGRWGGVLAAATVAAWVSPAMALKEAGAPEGANSWLHWVGTLVILAGISAIVFKNAKRSHQD